MSKYETVMILNNEITEGQKNNVIAKIKNYILANGEIIEEQNLGERRLAYEVNKQNIGYYYVIKFKAKSTSIFELERIYRITDEVLKFIVVKED